MLEEAVRIWRNGIDRKPESLGKPEFDFEFASGTRFVKHATLHLTEPGGRPLDIAVTPLLPVYIGIGTGYGLDADWRHGMYQGPLVVQGLEIDSNTPEGKAKLWGILDNVARFETGGEVGYGLFEYLMIGPYARFGFTGFDDGAP
jgi:hypothetical protein